MKMTLIKISFSAFAFLFFYSLTILGQDLSRNGELLNVVVKDGGWKYQIPKTKPSKSEIVIIDGKSFESKTWEVKGGRIFSSDSYFFDQNKKLRIKSRPCELKFISIILHKNKPFAMILNYIHVSFVGGFKSYVGVIAIDSIVDIDGDGVLETRYSGRNIPPLPDWIRSQ